MKPSSGNSKWIRVMAGLLAAIALASTAPPSAFAHESPEHVHANVGLPPCAATNECYRFQTLQFQDVSWIGNQCVVTLWMWDLDGDGDIDSLLPNPTFSYNALGSFNITLSLATTCEGTLSDTKALPIVNRAPTPGTLEPSQASATRLDTVSFTATGAADADGNVVGYIFRVDGVDRPEQASNVLNVTFSKLGTHTVTVRSKDNEGGISAPSNEATVTVVNILPTAVIGASHQQATRLDAVTFSGSGSSDPDGSVASYLFTIDGDTKPEQPGGTYMVTFGTLGQHTASLRVRDNDGGLSPPSATVTVEVVNIAPTASITGPGTANVNQPATFSGSASSDPDGTVTQFEFFVDDVSQGVQAGSGFTTSFATPGSHTVKLRVFDNDGGVSPFAQTTIFITENLDVTISGVNATYNPAEALVGGVGGTVHVANTDGSPVPGALVIVQVAHLSPVDGTTLRSEVVATGNADASGNFVFQVSLTYRLLGDFRIDVAAVGGSSAGFASQGYEVGVV